MWCVDLLVGVADLNGLTIFCHPSSTAEIEVGMYVCIKLSCERYAGDRAAELENIRKKYSLLCLPDVGYRYNRCGGNGTPPLLSRV